MPPHVAKVRTRGIPSLFCFLILAAAVSLPGAESSTLLHNSEDEEIEL